MTDGAIPADRHVGVFGFRTGADILCLSEIKLAHTDDEVRQEMA
jgi:hypothetical protein